MEELIELCKKQSNASKLLLDALLTLQTDGPVLPTQGICGNTQHFLESHTPWGMEEGADLDDWLLMMWPLWEYWTGSSMYPVPASNTMRCPDAARTAYTQFQEWDGSTEYGQLRLDLLNHCIVTLQEAIDRAKD